MIRLLIFILFVHPSVYCMESTLTKTSAKKKTVGEAIENRRRRDKIKLEKYSYIYNNTNKTCIIAYNREYGNESIQIENGTMWKIRLKKYPFKLLVGIFEYQKSLLSANFEENRIQLNMPSLRYEFPKQGYYIINEQKENLSVEQTNPITFNLKRIWNRLK